MPKDHEEAIADIAKPTPTEIPRATGPLFFDAPESAFVIAAPGIAPSSAEKRITPKVIATSVNTDSPIPFFNDCILSETGHK
jgi:hypothetical protein